MSITEPSGSEPANITNQIRQRQNETNGVAVSSPSGRDATEYVRQNLDNQESPGVGVPGCSCCTESNKSPQRLEIPDFEPNRKRPRVSNSTGQDNARPPLITKTELRAVDSNENIDLGLKKASKKASQKGRKLPKISTYVSQEIQQELAGETVETSEDLERVERKQKWAMLSALRDLIPWSRSADCCRIPLPESVNGVRGVSVFHTPKSGDQRAKARFGNVAQCGSVWLCPHCAPKIAKERAKELKRALMRHKEEGGRIMMITLTHRHHRDDRLSVQLEKQGRALQHMHRQRSYRELCSRHGVIGTVRSLEFTHSEANGWHAHVHLLVLIAGNSSQAQRHAEHMTELKAKRANYNGQKTEPVQVPHVAKLAGFGKEYTKKWREAAQKFGLVALAKGQKAEIAAEDERSIEQLASYLTKCDDAGQNQENLEAFDYSQENLNAAAENVWKANETNARGGSDAAKEVSLGALKVARKKDSKTPMQYLKEYATTGKERSGQLFAEFARAIHGRAALVWSRGLKDFYEVKTLSDQEVLEQEERRAESEEVIMDELNPYEWRAVLAGPRLARAHILEMSRNFDPVGIRDYVCRLVENFERRRATGPP